MINLNNFEATLNGRNSSVTTAPRAILGKSSMTLNTPAVALIGKHKAARILYDVGTKQIALELRAIKGPGEYTISSKDARYASVASRRLIEKHSLKKGTRYEVTRLAQDGRVFLLLTPIN